MSDFVWFFSVEVRALPSEDQPLVEGSEGTLQCFLPAPSLESALPTLDRFLEAEAFKRIGVRLAQRFRPEATREDVGNSLLSEGIEQVASTGLPCRGVLIVDRETSRWKSPAQEVE
jgi:hypothetical protein